MGAYMNIRNFPERLCVAMQKAGINARELATRAGISPSTLSHYKSGRSVNVTAEVAQKLADVLDVSVDWLVTGEGEYKKLNIIPLRKYLFGTTDMPEGIVLIPEYEVHFHQYNNLPEYEEITDCAPAYFRTSFFADRNINPTDCKRFVIKDDSMYPLIKPGDRITVDCSQAEHILNNQVYALIYDNNLIVKRLMKTFKHLTIHSDNTKYQDDVLTLDEAKSIIQIVGRVIERSGSI